MKRFLFYISENYSFEILRPVQQNIRKRGFEAAWFVEGKNVNKALFTPDELQLTSIKDVVSFQPDAVFVPGNVVPDFVPGLKVQVFHGFEWKKKGHFRVRGFFDLYCTQGPLFTEKFNQLKATYKHFQVAETGWPKVDFLFKTPAYQWPKQQDKPTILFAPTFSPSLTAAPTLFNEIQRLDKQGQWQWLVKFHPKMNPAWVKRYKSIQSNTLHVVESQSLAPLLQAADAMVSDTSSVITEFSLLAKPTVTLNNSQPEAHLINIHSADQLQQALELALSGEPQRKSLIESYVAQLHPYQDGQSASRVLDTALEQLENTNRTLKKKPVNIWRSLKLRKKLGYWY